MIILKMAFLNVFRQKRRSILTGLSMFVGFVLATIFIGWSDGTYNNIIDEFTRNTFGHIQVHEKNYLKRPSLYKTINNFSDLDKKLHQIPGINSWTPRIYSAGLASVGEKTTGVKIIGIDPLMENKTLGFNRKIVTGKTFSDKPKHEVIIGTGVAKILKTTVGDDIVIVSQGADGSIANDRYKIVGIADFGNDMTNRTAFYLPLVDAQELLVLGNRIHEIAITVDNMKQVLRINGIIAQIISDSNLSVDPWQEFAKSFYIAMKADQEGMYYTLIIIVLVVAVGVLNTVLMMVLERRREYGVLKAMGTRPFQIIKLVLTEVSILAFFSVILGVIVGWFINLILSQHGITLSEPFSYGGIEFKQLLSEVNVRMFIIPAITVFVSAILVGFFPALMAAHTEAARTMRLH